MAVSSMVVVEAAEDFSFPDADQVSCGEAHYPVRKATFERMYLDPEAYQLFSKPLHE